MVKKAPAVLTVGAFFAYNSKKFEKDVDSVPQVVYSIDIRETQHCWNVSIVYCLGGTKMSKQYFTVTELSRYWNCTPSAIYRAVKEKRLKPADEIDRIVYAGAKRVANHRAQLLFDADYIKNEAIPINITKSIAKFVAGGYKESIRDVRTSALMKCAIGEDDTSTEETYPVERVDSTINKEPCSNLECDRLERIEKRLDELEKSVNSSKEEFDTVKKAVIRGVGYIGSFIEGPGKSDK